MKSIMNKLEEWYTYNKDYYPQETIDNFVTTDEVGLIIKDYNEMKDCLAASLTLLVKLNYMTESKIEKCLKENRYTGLFDLINEKYKEITNEN